MAFLFLSIEFQLLTPNDGQETLEENKLELVGLGEVRWGGDGEDRDEGAREFPARKTKK